MAEKKASERVQERKTYTLPVGPQHPMYVEAENLMVHVDGETITGVDVNIGYMHRGIEEMMQRRNYLQNIYLAERICGICMPGNHEIILGDGSIVKLSEFIDKKIQEKPNPIISVEFGGSSVIASNDFHTKPKTITHVQKVKCPSKLFNVKTISGTEMTFTGDHPIMIDTVDGPKMVRTKNVVPGDRVYSPRKINIESRIPSLIECMPDNYKIVLNSRYYRELRARIRNDFSTLTEFSKKTGISKWRIQRMRQKLRIHEFRKLCNAMNLNWAQATKNIEKLSVHGSTIRHKGLEIDEEMMNVLGLLASDGYFGNMRCKGKHYNHRITFVNKENTLIKKVECLHKKHFPKKNVDRFIMQSSTTAIRISNPILTFVAKKLGLNALDKKTVDIKEIFKLPEGHIAAFLRGYFDGDGTCGKNEIIFYTSDNLMAKRLRLLLKRVGIASSISSSASKGFKAGTRWSVSITNMDDLLKFMKEIGSNHPKKKTRIMRMKNGWRKNTFYSMFQLAPKKAGPLLRSIRKKYGLSYKDIGALDDLSKIETRKKNVMKWRMKKYLKEVRRFAKKGDKDVEELENLLTNRFFVEPIKEIQEIESNHDYVYDLTVDEAHNFIPEGGFVVGNCSGIHSVAYCECVENLLGVDIPRRAEHIRTVILELERLHSHFLFLGVVGYEMGLDTMFMYTWKDRELVMDMLEEISGNRVNYAMPTIGGVRRDIPEKIRHSILKRLPHLDKRFDYYRNVFSKDRAIRRRTQGLGILPKAEANRLSIQGPVLRASGVSYDVRRDAPYAAYPEIRDWKVVVENEGDVHARVLQKIMEMYEAAKILKRALTRLPHDGLKTRVSLSIPENEALSVTEAPRGELIYYARSNGTDVPERMRMRTPSFSNMLALPVMLKGQQLGDLPVIVGSIDPCFSCTDRVTLVEERTGESRTVDATYLKRLAEKKQHKK